MRVFHFRMLTIHRTALYEACNRAISKSRNVFT